MLRQFVRARRSASALVLTAMGALTAGCASVSGGPPRLYSVEDELALIRPHAHAAAFAAASVSEVERNRLIAARMYAIDIAYTNYEANLTKERQGVGFGAAASTIGLATASTLVTPVKTKDVLTALAGAVTGARAAYEDEVLLAHSMQWIQSQMRAQRALVAARILRGTRMPISQYPLPEALTDLEDYYRAGTFTGGLLKTTETVAAEARFAEEIKGERVEVVFGPSSAGRVLGRCFLNLPRNSEARRTLVSLAPGGTPAAFFALTRSNTPAARATAEAVLTRAQQADLCL
jgi:hypothetical protein